MPETGPAANPPVVLSSTCFRERDIRALCEILTVNGIERVELSGNLAPVSADELDAVLNAYAEPLTFYVHNYFPAPATPFVLNLAHPDTLDRSMAHCLAAIELCARFGMRQYSVHGGFAFNPQPADLGHDQSHLLPIDFGHSRQIFIDAALALGDAAADAGIELLFENNVVAAYNCPDGRNAKYHLADPADTSALLSIFAHPAIGMMLDTGHLKVSARTLNFNPADFLDRVRPHIRAVQISDNDGTADQNNPVREDSWFWDQVPWAQADYVSLEVSRQTTETMLTQIALTREFLAGDHGAN